MTTLADQSEFFRVMIINPPILEKDMYTILEKHNELYAIQADCDVKATNIILQGLPLEVYVTVASSITKELGRKNAPSHARNFIMKQKESLNIYEFDKFAYKKGETPRDFYLRFLLLLNDMNIYNVKLE
ncbi:hypothetical protein Tco_0519056 [Tanacetum coccineum]